MATWKIIDPGRVVEGAPGVQQVDYTCPHCGAEALLPVRGLILAQLNNGGLVFEGPYEMPRHIQCRKCRRQFDRGGE
jgi:hypothetical protein